jgi:PHD/YefM family antitoxin component YafN of YafNO toxin-antitoxin module
MLTPKQIHPLTDFLRNHKSHIKELNTSGSPQVYTVNGRAEIVVMGAQAYQELAEKLEELSRLEAIRIGIEAIKKGDAISAKEARTELKALYDL